jgi:type IV pilus assembly protein PilW
MEIRLNPSVKVFTGNKGFTLIELMVTLAIASIFLLAVIQLFITTNQVNTIQEQLAGTQQNIRVAMELMSRDIRMAGLDPTEGAGNAGFYDGGDDEQDTDSNSIAIRYDMDGDGNCEIDRIYYYNDANERLMIREDGTNRSLTEDGTISSVSFSYTLDDDSVDDDPSGNGNLAEIRVVSVQVCGKITGAFEDEHTATYCFSNTVRPRNM